MTGSAYSKMRPYLICVLLCIACTSVFSLLPESSKFLPTLRRQLGAVLISSSLLIPGAVFADARLNAPSAAGTRVNSDAYSLLRNGLPINSKELRDIQISLESIKDDLKGRRMSFVENDISNFKGGLKQSAAKILKYVPKSRVAQATESIARLEAGIPQLQAAVQVETSSGSGSIQQRDSLDEAFAFQDALSREFSLLEELAVPEGFKRNIPSEYAKLPRLQGRAEVAVVLKKADNTQFNVEGKLYDKLKMTMVLDGYNAPLTAGNIIDLVNKHFYDKKPITRADGFVVQTGDADPAGTVHGYVPPGSSIERAIPLEIALKGDSELLYGVTSEDDGRGYAAAVLPFQSYGALGMARSEYEADSASSQFFWLLFESDLTPAGKNLLDGRYSCFGYTTEGGDLLKGVHEGDIVESMTVTKGGENLITP